MSRPEQRRPSFWFIWGWPSLLAILTLFGLLAALLGQEGVWLWLSWSTLTMPLVVVTICLALAARDGSAGSKFDDGDAFSRRTRR